MRGKGVYLDPEYPPERDTGFTILRNLLSSCEAFLNGDRTGTKLAQCISFVAFKFGETESSHYLQKILDRVELWAPRTRYGEGLQSYVAFLREPCHFGSYNY